MKLLSIRATIGMMFGVIALFWSGLTQNIFIYLLGIFILLDGLVAVTISSSTRKKVAYLWVLLEGGILAFGICTYTLLWPTIAALLLLWLIGLWSIMSSIPSIVTVFLIGHPFKQKWFIVLCGILSFLLGIFLFPGPGIGVISLVFLLGTFNIVYGMLFFIRAFQLRMAFFIPKF